MNRLGAILILFLFLLGVLLACQLEYVLPTPAPSTVPRATRTKTPATGAPIVPPTSAAPQQPPGFLPGGSALVIATAKENLRVRAAPSVSSQQVGSLNKGDTAQVVGKNAAGDWWQILLPSNPNARGWILASFTEVSGPTESIQVVSSDSVPASQPYLPQQPLPSSKPYP